MVVQLPEGGSPDNWGSSTRPCTLGYGHRIECWGDNQFGQVDPPADRFVSLSAGGWHTCGLRADGTLTCWGDSTYGQSNPSAGRFVSVSAGDGIRVVSVQMGPLPAGERRPTIGTPPLTASSLAWTQAWSTHVRCVRTGP